MLRFNFDAQAGETPASIAQKRALVAQIMGTVRAPQNVGEGFAAIGDGIVANVLGGRADDAQRAGQSSADDTFSRLVASITGQGAGVPQTASDATASMAGGDFLSGLVQSESGGNWNALNNEGYGGRLQFGDARLADAAAAGLVPQGTTGAMFSRMSPEQQQAVEAWHFNDIEQQADRMGLSQYYGQTIAGVPITPESVKAMAHLGGIGGAQKFITSGGQYNPADSNGTRLSDYGTRFGGTGGARTQVAQGPDLAMLMEASANPWLSDSQKSVINSMIAQQMQQMDPAYQQGLRAGDLGIQKAEIELEQLRNKPPPLPDAPKTEKIYDPETGREVTVQWDGQQWKPLGGTKAPEPTSNMRDYDAYAADEIAAGRQPLNRLQYEQEVRKAGASNITTNVGGEQTPGWKKIDETFGETYLDWVSGGWADTRKQLEQLGEAVKILESGNDVTGTVGLLPREMGAFFNPDGTIARENVEEVVQRSLREILGAQFTEREGERLIARAFNPLLSPAENAKRVNRLLDTISGMAESKQGMVDYFDQNGTLRGFQGQRVNASALDALANEFGEAPNEAGAEATRQSQPPRFNSQADYDAAPSGTVFTAPDGSIRVKP